jgi:hypothetical protein
MSLTKLIPSLLYTDVRVGHTFFTEALDFKTLHADAGFYIIERDDVIIHLVQQDGEVSMKERPALRIQTDDIEGLYKQISNNTPQWLHPNASTIKIQPWGVKEFTLLDETYVCVTIQQSIEL